MQVNPIAQGYVDQGYAALQVADWTDAHQSFEKALLECDAPEAYDGLGIACWWLNDIRGAHAHRMAAYNGFKVQGQTGRAVFIACWLAREQVFLHGNAIAMQGWFARAASLVETLTPCPECSWYSMLRASMLESPQELEQTARKTIQSAREFQDRNLEAFALAFRGLAQVTQGRISQGMARLDEAMTMTTGGEIVDYTIISEIFCVMLSACEVAGDLIRGEQWCRKAWEFAEQNQCPFLSAYCRTTYGSILTAMGRWQDAEGALVEAIQTFETGHQGLRIHAVIRLADLYVYQGRLEEARVMLEGLQDQEAAAVPLARLSLAKHETSMANTILAQHLQSCPPYTLNHLPALVLLVEIWLTMDNLDAAQQLVGQLIDLAQQTESAQLLAQAELTKGRVLLHAGKPALAKECFMTALDQVRAFQQSLLAGQIRLNMARTLQESDPPGAIVWAKAALATFDRIGTVRDRAETAHLLRQLGAAPGPNPRLRNLLTQRESEITLLLAQGLTNREISERLVISPKTVEHHVSHILGKLDLRSRTEVAALAMSGKLEKLTEVDQANPS